METFTNLYVRNKKYQTLPRFRGLLAGLSSWKPRFNARIIHVGFVILDVAMGQVSPRRILLFSPVHHCTNDPHSSIHLPTPVNDSVGT